MAPGLLRPAVHRRRQRHHRDPAGVVDQRHHQHAAARRLRRSRRSSFWVTKRICLSLQRRDRDLVLHGRETGRIVRTAEGKFFEVHEALDEHERWRLVQHETLEPLRAAGVRGQQRRSPLRRTHGPARARCRASTSPTASPAVTPAELAAAHHDGAAHEALAEAPAPTEWDRSLHGGAVELADNDAYAPHAHEDGEAARGRPRRGDHRDSLTPPRPRRPLPACAGRGRRAVTDLTAHARPQDDGDDPASRARRALAPLDRAHPRMGGWTGADDAGRSSRRPWVTPWTRFPPSCWT